MPVGDKWLLSYAGMYAPNSDVSTCIEVWKQYPKVFLNALYNIDLVIEDIITEGDKVLVRWKTRGKHKGDLRGLSPTGKQLRLPGDAIYLFKDKQIVEMWA